MLGWVPTELDEDPMRIMGMAKQVLGKRQQWSKVDDTIDVQLRFLDVG